MTGILLFAVFCLWLWICVAITHALVARNTARWWRAPAAIFMFGILLVLPVIDEVIGGFQFRALCETGAVLKIDVAKAKGRVVRLVIDPSNQPVAGQLLRTLHSHYSYRAIDTDEEIASLNTYEVDGGLLVLLLGISNSNSPLTIGSAACSPPDRGLLDKKYGFRLIN